MKLLILLVALGATWAIGDATPYSSYTYDCTHCQPEQIHISFGEKSDDIVVTWSTFNDTDESAVEYGVGGMTDRATGTSTLFRDGGRKRREQYIHRVTLPNLQYNTTYEYHCGSNFGWSELFTFHVPPAGSHWPVRAAIYGDMGNKNAHSLSYLQDEAERGHFDLVLHVGDFAYDMHDDDARVGDQFMRQIQPLAAMVPYMTCPGNHEEKYNFSNYRARFSMPGGTESLFYSFDLGPVHFVSISTEFYYFMIYGAKLLFKQYNWLEKNLAEANRRENRAVRPWVVLMGHRPMYCSNSDDIDCSLEYTRRGVPLLGLALEPLLQKYSVDLVIWAHEHSYERTWPLFDSKVYNGSIKEPYHNPRAPVHLVTGSAGCQEEHSKFNGTRPEWSAFRSEAYGYTRLVAHNDTHLHLEQVDVEQGGEVVDSFWMVKQNGAARRAPVHIITGSAGCQEETDPFYNHPYNWSAFRSTDYGYTRFVAHNHSHIYMEQVSVDKLGQVIDSFWLVKDKKAPVHIVTGSAGSQEGRDRFYHNPYKWSAFRSQDFGYTRFVAHNHSHIYMEQISVDLQGEVIDSFWLVKDRART